MALIGCQMEIRTDFHVTSFKKSQCGDFAPSLGRIDRYRTVPDPLARSDSFTTPPQSAPVFLLRLVVRAYPRYTSYLDDSGLYIGKIHHGFRCLDEEFGNSTQPRCLFLRGPLSEADCPSHCLEWPPWMMQYLAAERPREATGSPPTGPCSTTPKTAITLQRLIQTLELPLGNKIVPDALQQGRHGVDKELFAFGAGWTEVVSPRAQPVVMLLWAVSDGEIDMSAGTGMRESRAVAPAPFNVSLCLPKITPAKQFIVGSFDIFQVITQSYVQPGTPKVPRYNGTTEPERDRGEKQEG